MSPCDADSRLLKKCQGDSTHTSFLQAFKYLPRVIRYYQMTACNLCLANEMQNRKCHSRRREAAAEEKKLLSHVDVDVVDSVNDACDHRPLHSVIYRHCREIHAAIRVKTSCMSITRVSPV